MALRSVASQLSKICLQSSIKTKLSPALEVRTTSWALEAATILFEFGVAKRHLVEGGGERDATGVPWSYNTFNLIDIIGTENFGR
jgi:hypothetical protein